MGKPLVTLNFTSSTWITWHRACAIAAVTYDLHACYVSQGSVATQIRRGWKLFHQSIGHFLLRRLCQKLL